MIKKKVIKNHKKRLDIHGTNFKSSVRDGLGVISSSACAEASVLPFRTVKSWRSRISVLCSSAVHSSLVCERPRPGYRRAIFIGDDLAL
jgi:hypothetical protein